MAYQAILTTDWNRIKSLDDFNAEWPSFSADMGISSLPGVMSRPSCDARISDLDDINDLVGYYAPLGRYVSTLDNAKSLTWKDLFAVSQKRELSVGSGVEWQSRRLTYADLSSRLFHDVYGALGLKSMAFKQKYQYALSSHNHDDVFSRVNMAINPLYDHASPSYVGDGNVIDVCSCWISTDYLSCGHTGGYESVSCNPAHSAVRTKAVVFRVPHIVPPLPPKPMIGTLRFVGAKTVSALVAANMLSVQQCSSSSDGTVQVNPYDADGNIRDDYDGWMFANGTTIQNIRSQLSAAAVVYARQANLDFTTPRFDHFFTANCGDVSEPLNVRPYQVGLKRHLHDTKSHSFNGTIALNREKTQMYSTYENGGGNYVHHGDKEKSTTSKVVTASLAINFDQSSFSNVKVTQCAGVGEEPYPRHQVVPVMVYVGGETRAYYERQYGK